MSDAEGQKSGKASYIYPRPIILSLQLPSSGPDLSMESKTLLVAQSLGFRLGLLAETDPFL
jgi:hypothetical protein